MIKLPNSLDPAALTDWLEASLTVKSKTPFRVSDAEILGELRDRDTDDPDALLANVIAQVDLRKKAIGDAYPFERQGQGFIRLGTWDEYLCYSFLLMTSLNQFYIELNFKGGTANKPAELFEHVTAIALRNYLGSQIIRMGAPRRNPVPSSFPLAIDHVVARVGEALGQRDIEDHKSGDDRADVIAWKPFDDGRPSQLMVFGQCAIGTDWASKRDELSLDLWRRHIDWHSHPVKVFAVPFHHEADKPWRETATRAGIVFDRLRIARLVPKRPAPKKLSSDIAKWAATRVKAAKRLEID